MAESQEGLKAILLKLCSMVNNAQPDVVNILKEQPLCNIKTVQRKAKNLKDPNPLTSMMSTINTKYPISVDTKKALACGLPRHFLHEPDAHQYGRTICKLDAIQWYVDNAALPSTETAKAIKVLYRRHEKDVADYYNYKWKNSTIQFGPVSLDRQQILLNPEALKIPLYERTKYILHCISPHLVLNRDALDQNVIAQLEELRDISFEAKLNIQTQIRVLASAIDTMPRFYPCIRGWSDQKNKHRYILCSDRHMVNVLTHKVDEKADFKFELDILGRICKIMKECGIMNDDMEKHLRFVRLSGATVSERISGARNLGVYAKLVAILYKLPIELSLVSRGFEFVLIDGISRAVTRRNRSKFPFVEYLGAELWGMTGQNIHATFRHNGSVVQQITCRPCSDRELKQMLTEIAIFCRYDFGDTVARYKGGLYREIETKIKAAPWGILNIDQKRFKSHILKGKTAGILTFVEEVERMHPKKFYATWDKPEVISFSNGSEETVVFPRTSPVLTADFQTLGFTIFTSFIPGFQGLKETYISFLGQERSKIMKYIEKGFFNHMNAGIHYRIPETIREGVAGLAREVLKKIYMNADVHLTLFIYCFAFSLTPPRTVHPESIFQWDNTHPIDFAMSSGICFFRGSEVFFNGEVISTVAAKVDGIMCPNILPGFRMEKFKADVKVPYSTLQWLGVHKEKIRHGRSFVVNLWGFDYLITRDTQIDLSAQQTITRLVNQARGNALEHLTDVEKRKREKDVEEEDKRFALDPAAGEGCLDAYYEDEDIEDCLDI